MTEHELIAKQQLEIESLKIVIDELRDSINSAIYPLIFIQQWGTTSPEFPRKALNAIIEAQKILSDTVPISED